MQQSYKVFTVIGILFTVLLGSLSHFFYEWSGNFFLVGLFSPVNESVWEHLKLLFFPALLFMLLEQRLLSYRCPDLLCKNLTGLYAGLLSMPLLFYGYTLFTKKSFLWVDITIFILNVLITCSPTASEKRNFLIPYAALIRQPSISCWPSSPSFLSFLWYKHMI